MNNQFKNDNKLQRAQQFANLVCEALRDYIPHKCFRDAWHHVAKIAYEQELEISNGEQRKTYEAMRQTLIEKANILPLKIEPK